MEPTFSIRTIAHFIAELFLAIGFIGLYMWYLGAFNPPDDSMDSR